MLLETINVALPHYELQRRCHRIRRAVPMVTVGQHHLLLQHLLLSSRTTSPLDALIHTHTHHEVLLILQGEGCDQSSRQPLPTGSVLVHGPAMPHGWQGVGEACGFLSVRFSAEPLLAMPQPTDAWPVWPAMTGLVIALLHEATGEIPGWTERARALLTTLLARPLYACGLIDADPDDVIVSDEGEQFVDTITQYLRARLADAVTVDEVASAVQMSRRSLTRNFRRLTGHSLQDYLFNMRMDLAVELLMDTDLPMVEVTRQTGFTNPSYFTLRFHTRYHCTPSQWRKRFQSARYG